MWKKSDMKGISWELLQSKAYLRSKSYYDSGDAFGIFLDIIVFGFKEICNEFSIFNFLSENWLTKIWRYCTCQLGKIVVILFYCYLCNQGNNFISYVTCKFAYRRTREHACKK